MKRLISLLVLILSAVSCGPVRVTVSDGNADVSTSTQTTTTTTIQVERSHTTD